MNNRKIYEEIEQEINKMGQQKTIKQIYLAAPLFTAAEQQFNESLAQELITCGIKIFLPQNECSGLFSSLEIYKICRNGVKSSNLVVAILDGADADSGTCWECGFATALNIPVVGLRTDLRGSGDDGGWNLMLKYSCQKIIDTRTDYIKPLKQSVSQILGCEY